MKNAKSRPTAQFTTVSDVPTHGMMTQARNEPSSPSVAALKKGYSGIITSKHATIMDDPYWLQKQGQQQESHSLATSQFTMIFQTNFQLSQVL